MRLEAAQVGKRLGDARHDAWHESILSDHQYRLGEWDEALRRADAVIGLSGSRDHDRHHRASAHRGAARYGWRVTTPLGQSQTSTARSNLPTQSASRRSLLSMSSPRRRSLLVAADDARAAEAASRFLEDFSRGNRRLRGRSTCRCLPSCRGSTRAGRAARSGPVAAARVAMVGDVARRRSRRLDGGRRRPGSRQRATRRGGSAPPGSGEVPGGRASRGGGRAASASAGSSTAQFGASRHVRRPRRCSPSLGQPEPQRRNAVSWWPRSCQSSTPPCSTGRARTPSRGQHARGHAGARAAGADRHHRPAVVELVPERAHEPVRDVPAARDVALVALVLLAHVEHLGRVVGEQRLELVHPDRLDPLRGLELEHVAGDGEQADRVQALGRPRPASSGEEAWIVIGSSWSSTKAAFVPTEEPSSGTLTAPWAWPAA